MPAEQEDALDSFGEDDGQAAKPAVKGDQNMWYIESQRAWEFNGELCTLTCEENGDFSHMRFELLKKNNDLVTVVCTKEQFQSLYDEHTELLGPARTDAVITHLFKEGLAEFPESALAAPAAPTAPAAKGGEDDLDAFGEDDDEGTAKPQKVPTGLEDIGPDEWYIESELSWNLGGELCMMMCSTTGNGSHLRYEVFKSNGDTITITCTRQQFQDLCDEQKETKEPARTVAAIHQLFKEGLEEFPDDAPMPVPEVHKNLSRRLKAMFRGWSRCSADGMVSTDDMKAILRRIHPGVPDSLMDSLMATAVDGRVNVEALIDEIIKGTS